MRTRTRFLILALGCSLSAAACDERERAPLGDPGSGGGGGSSGMPDAGDTDTFDTDTGEPQVQCAADEVPQPATNLCWMRCPLGREATGDGPCEGPVALYEFAETFAACGLLGAGHQPATREQMISLLGGCETAVIEDWDEGFCDPCDASETCAQMFGFDPETYWTSTTGEFSPWAVSFDSGAVFMPGSALEQYAVRCVRQGD